MADRETVHQERKVMSSAEIASGYVRRMVENETRGWGDTESALSRVPPSRHAARLLHEAETAMAVNPDDDVAAIEDQIRALAARLEAAKAHSKRKVR